MSFLKKLGQILATVASTAVGLGPLVTPLFGSGGGKVAAGITTATNDLTAIGSVIVQIETALQGKTGEDKLAAAVALVGPILTTSQLVSGKHIADATMFQKGVTEVTQGIVDVLNSLDQKSVSTEVKS